MGRKKVTYEIDEDLVRSIKGASLAEGKPEYAVVEDALRGHLLKPLLERAWAEMGDLSEEEAIRIAIEEVAAVRAARGQKRKRTG